MHQFICLFGTLMGWPTYADDACVSWNILVDRKISTKQGVGASGFSFSDY